MPRDIEPTTSCTMVWIQTPPGARVSMEDRVSHPNDNVIGSSGAFACGFCVLSPGQDATPREGKECAWIVAPRFPCFRKAE